MQTSSHCTRTCNTTAALYTKLKQRRLHYLFGHNVRMDDSQILKDLLYSEFAQGKRPTGRFQLRYKDVCKGHPKASGIDINELKTSASKRSTWRRAIKQALSEFKETLSEQAETIKKGQTRNALSKPATNYICSLRGRDSHYRISPSSHARRCSRTTNHSATP